MNLTKQDIEQLESIGKSTETAKWEISLLSSGVPRTNLERRCRTGDGITALNREQEIAYTKRFEKASLDGLAVKFVAASGAASRMFCAPFNCLLRQWVTHSLLIEKSQCGYEDAAACLQLLRNLSKFALFPSLKSLMSSKGLDLESLVEDGNYRDILENLLTDRGLNYSRLPKGLIPFHSYPKGARTAFEEHLVESRGYLKDGNNLARIHFTVSQNHLEKVRKHLQSAISGMRGIDTQFDVTFSVQKNFTDTVVLDKAGRPLRDNAGKLILRPSGHGALLENLNGLESDIIFIRTIDNVLPEGFHETVCFHKKILGGYLIKLQEELFNNLHLLSSRNLDEQRFQKILQFSETQINLHPPADFYRLSLQARVEALFQRLDAPLRVCGMVKNPGYPGGRPFWVRDEDGWERLQIVEAAQVDGKNTEQNDIWNSCEFFNPADIVCGIRDYSGQAFDIKKFCDFDSGLIAEKAYNGRECRVLERPGLWNGSMARWNTAFIEVPAITLRPVKTILDLLTRQNKH